MVLFLLGFDAMSGVCFSSLQRNVMCWSAGSNRDECLVLKKKALHFYEKLVTIHASPQCLVLGVLFGPHHHCENLESKYMSSVNPWFYIVWFLCETVNHSK